MQDAALIGLLLDERFERAHLAARYATPRYIRDRRLLRAKGTAIQMERNRLRTEWTSADRRDLREGRKLTSSYAQRINDEARFQMVVSKLFASKATES